MALSYRPQGRGHLAMLLYSALIAGSFSFGSMIANDIDPVALTALRFLLAGVVIGTAAALGPGLRLSSYRAPWRFAVLGGLFAIYFVTMFEGLKTAPPIATSAVFTLTPIMSAGFGWLILREITTPRMALALSVGGLGALWVIFRADLHSVFAFDIGRGEAIFFIGCFSHAIYTPFIRKLNRGEPALVFTFGMMVAAFVVLTAYGWPAIRATHWGALPLKVWLVLGYLAFCASALTFVLLHYAAMQLPAAKVMAYTYLTPSWVICWEIALGHGIPQGLTLIGVGMTMLALWLLLED